VFWLSSQKARDLFLGLFFNHEFTRNNGEKEDGIRRTEYGRKEKGGKGEKDTNSKMVNW
jgi:hypothetical protein